MTDTTDLKIQEKKELDTDKEKTFPGKHYLPYTDIYENGDALTVIMEIPGVSKDAVDIMLDKDELRIFAGIKPENYEDYQPVYTEYSIGHFSRSFTLSSKIDKDKIEASVADGVLTLTLPKMEEAKPRSIKIN